MTAQLLYFQADGTTPAGGMVDFGFAAPGADPVQRVVTFKNTGDTPALRPQLGIGTVGASDLEQWVTGEYGGQLFSASSPLTIPDIPPGATGQITLTCTVPPDAPALTTPVNALLFIERDQDA